jgi:6-phosphofructokinase 1
VLRIFLDPRPFREAFTEFGEYKEGQDNVVLSTFENGQLSGYCPAVGLSESERAARDAWVSLEQTRKDRVTLKPRRLKRLIALVSGGDFAGAGAARKELRVTGNRLGLDIYFVRQGFLGLANNWIEAVTEEDTRGMSSHASSPIGSSRFEDFKDEEVQAAAMRHLKPYPEDGALVVLEATAACAALAPSTKPSVCRWREFPAPSTTTSRTPLRWVFTPRSPWRTSPSNP